MSRALLFCSFCLCSYFVFGQDITVTGTIQDSDRNPLAYATVLLYEVEGETPLKGAVSEMDGTFKLSGLKTQPYKISYSFIGFETLETTIELTLSEDLGNVTLKENTESLDETVVTAQRPTIEKTAGKLVFNVENTSLSTGSTFDLLKKTPGVVVIGEEIKIKFSNPVIYINDKRVYLSPSEVISLLQNTDASAIKSVEVITSPSAKYDSEASTVLNIVTSRAISIGYKGSVSGRYEQAIFPKYSASTSHFYKNDWFNFYGSYTYSPRKEFKEDENFTRYFNPDELTTKQIWESKFTRTTRSQAHQANIAADFTLNQRNALNLTISGLISPNKTFDNTVDAEIRNALRSLDSTFITSSNLFSDTHNVSINLEHSITIGDQGTKLNTAVNYTSYEDDQQQDVATRYFLPDGDLSSQNSFFTDALQNTHIFTGRLDVTTGIAKGIFETGLKYSNIDTESGLDFFDTDSGSIFNASLSDLFLYEEAIYAGYANYSREWEKVAVSLGLRGEYTSVTGDSRSLGLINTQEYFELFPTLSVEYNLDEQNSVGATYKRSIERPRYQSLNPFRYFINENNFNSGNPNLVPAITNRVQLSWAHKRKWFFDVYYEGIDDELVVLVFQDNENTTLRNSEANLIRGFQYSFDVRYASYVNKWWYLTIATSNYYLRNQFFSVESSQETFADDTYGFFSQMFSRVTLSQKQSLTSDVSFVYISDFLTGSSFYENLFNLSISFRKAFWDNRASLTVGVDDIFNTNNVEVSSRYYNQDNSYFPRIESRLFRVGFRYNFGNARLRDNSRSIDNDENERLESN